MSVDLSMAVTDNPHVQVVNPVWADPSLFDPDAFDKKLNSGQPAVSVFKEAIAHTRQELDQRYRAGAQISSLVCGRAWFIDELLRRVWNLFDWKNSEHLSLLAVGGYGRGELHPHSDIDLLLLMRGDQSAVNREALSQFFTFLWARKRLQSSMLNVPSMLAVHLLMRYRYLSHPIRYGLRSLKMPASRSWAMTSRARWERQSRTALWLSYFKIAVFT
jgi:predicted nucleotidyltransferase